MTNEAPGMAVRTRAKVGSKAPNSQYFYELASARSDYREEVLEVFRPSTSRATIFCSALRQLPLHYIQHGGAKACRRIGNHDTI